MEIMVKHILFPALLTLLRQMGEEIEVIYERNEAAIRELEGLPRYQGFVQGEGLCTETDGKVLIRENGIQYEVDYINGQKTFTYNRLDPEPKDQYPFDDYDYYMILSAQLGGHWIGPIEASQLPVKMEIDYVRFYLPKKDKKSKK